MTYSKAKGRMLPSWNKTARVPPYKRTETHKRYTHTLRTHSQHLETLWEHFGSLGVSRKWCKTWKDRVVFIGPEKQRTSSQGVYIRHLYTAVQRLLRTCRYYPEGIPKSSVRPVLWCMSSVRFAECTSSGPPLHVYTINSTVRPPDLVYVRPKV